LIAPPGKRTGHKDLVQGRVYVLENIVELVDGTLGFKLVGLRTVDVQRRVILNHYWLASRFRPLKKAETDISVFTGMLGKKEKV